MQENLLGHDDSVRVRESPRRLTEMQEQEIGTETGGLFRSHLEEELRNSHQVTTDEWRVTGSCAIRLRLAA
jgi:hypothetical protein